MRQKPDFGELPEGMSRLSHHRLWCYENCGALYKFEFIDQLRYVRSNLAIGIGTHETGRESNTRKKEEKPGLPPKEGSDISVAAYDEAMESGEKTETREEIDTGRDLAASAGSEYVQQVAPTIRRPKMVEEPVLVQLEEKIQVCGVIDLVEGEIVRELKTGKRAWTQDKADRSTQLTGYGVLYQAMEGQPPHEYIVDTMYHLKKGWVHKQVATTRGEEDFTAWQERIRMAEKGIQAGYFPPAAEGSIICRPSFCQFWNICPYVAHRPTNENETA